MKLQYKSRLPLIKTNLRYLLYRIEPSELSWWKRYFENPWRNVFTSFKYAHLSDKGVNGCLSFLFSAKEAHEIIEKYDTYEKITDFLIAEYKKARNNYYEAQEKYKNDRWDF